jgi:hypothetical protein
VLASASRPTQLTTLIPKIPDCVEKWPCKCPTRRIFAVAGNIHESSRRPHSVTARSVSMAFVYIFKNLQSPQLTGETFRKRLNIQKAQLRSKKLDRARRHEQSAKMPRLPHINMIEMRSQRLRQSIIVIAIQSALSQTSLLIKMHTRDSSTVGHSMAPIGAGDARTINNGIAQREP